MESEFLNWSLTGADHLTVIARGRIDAAGVRQIFLNVVEITQVLVGGGVLIDLRQGRYRLTYGDIDGMLNELKPALWTLHNRIALVSAPRIEQSDQLFVLGVCFSGLGFEDDVFCDICSASDV